MTVQELIEKLSTLPQDMTVVLHDNDWCINFDAQTVEIIEEDDDGKQVVLID